MKEDTNGEVRVTDPETGGQKGQKPARFDLIPPAIWEVAELYGKGAAKYAEYGECTCRVPVGDPSKQRGGVTLATKSTTETPTPSTQNASGHTTPNGWSAQGIKSGAPSSNERHEVGSPSRQRRGAPKLPGNTDSLSKNTTPSWPNPAASAESDQSTWTTATPQGSSVAGSATAATSDLGTSKDGSQNTMSQHEPGCPALVVTQTGDWNWRQGYAWSLSYAAMQRHANLFWSGEDVDPETGCEHMASVVFHALALMTFALEHPEKDDRYGTTQLGVDEGAADLKERIKVVDDARSVRDDLPYTYESPFRPPEALLSNVGRDQGGSEGDWQRAWADHFERSSRG